MSEQDARERVAQALYYDWQITTAGAAGMDITDAEIEEAWQHHLMFTRANDWEPSPRFLAQATAAITAYDAWLRERAQDADVVEAVAQGALWGTSRTFAQVDINNALDAMIGKEDDHVD